MNPLHRQRNVPPAGPRLITKAGFREELHPRGYHGRWIGSTLKPRGGRHEVVAKGSGETIGHISKVDRRLNIRPVTRERYHVAVHRGEHVGNFDTRANAHAEISERERLHQGLGPSVEHAQLKRVNENIMMEKGSRTIANANAARLQRQALNSRLTPEGRSKAYADRAKHLDRAQEASRRLEDFHQEQKYLQGKLIKEGGKAKIDLEGGAAAAAESAQRRTDEANANLIKIPHTTDKHGTKIQVGDTVRSHLGPTEGKVTGIVRSEITGSHSVQVKDERGYMLFSNSEVAHVGAPEAHAPEVHAHQVGTIVQFKNPSGVLAGANQYRVAESRPEGVVLTGRRREGGTSKLYGHDQVEPVSRPIDWSNNEVAQHERIMARAGEITRIQQLEADAATLRDAGDFEGARMASEEAYALRQSPNAPGMEPQDSDMGYTPGEDARPRRPRSWG